MVNAKPKLKLASVFEIFLLSFIKALVLSS